MESVYSSTVGYLAVRFGYAQGAERLSNYDVRELRGRVQPTDEQGRGIAELKRETPVWKSPWMQGWEPLAGFRTRAGFLTGPDPQFVVALNNPGALLSSITTGR
jgi:hypothetical protein